MIIEKSCTINEVLKNNSEKIPDEIAYTFLSDGENIEENITYEDLNLKALNIGSYLLNITKKNQRAILIYPSGLEYLYAFFGCLYSSVISIPVYPPRLRFTNNDSNLDRIRTIIKDASPEIVLTTKELFIKLKPIINNVKELEKMKWIKTDEIISDRNKINPLDIKDDQIAFLQYTSGSVGNPKGVMVTHKNLIYNQKMIKKSFSNDRKTSFFSWLPLYHDMGLIGNVIQPLYLGVRCVFMSPTHFLQKPFRWLKGITKYKVTLSGGPNFSYDLCADKISDEEKKSLDLSSWKTAYNGAEPIRAETLTNFYNNFKECGFSYESFYPCYGMAETTLIVSGGEKKQKPVIKYFDKDLFNKKVIKLSHDSAGNEIAIVGCGKSILEQKIIIVDPDTNNQLCENQIGEILVSGDHITKGYWGNPELTKEKYNNYIRDNNNGPFFRTGDLGFFNKGELYITGRIKELIIIRGKNYYPGDIEESIQKTDPVLNNNCGAAFSVQIDNQERLIIVQELHRHYKKEELDKIIKKIIKTVLDKYQINIYSILLIKTGKLPKTTSGKIQRNKVKKSFLEKKIKAIHIWRDESSQEINNNQLNFIKNNSFNIDQIRDWLISQISNKRKLNITDININSNFSQFGLDSADAVSITGDIEKFFKIRIDPTILYEYSTINKLSEYVYNKYFKILNKSIQQIELDNNMDLNNDIAIIGMSCRFPQSNNIDEFWQLLSEGRNGFSELSNKRKKIFDEINFTHNSICFYSIEDIDMFDSDFFEISPKEAKQMDPQQRIILELTHHALEDAGINKESLFHTKTGVYIGISNNDYANLILTDYENINSYSVSGNALSFAANRISYYYGLNGPSMAVDTACSSSLTALHQACKAIVNNEIDLAIVGGINLILSSKNIHAMKSVGIVSSDNICRPFDADANGTVRGEGGGIIIIKKLPKAVKDNDNIYSVIIGSAVNQDGASNGIMAPNKKSQEKLLKNLYDKTKVNPDKLGYFETHGTGTLLGDPIEVNAISDALTSRKTRTSSCPIGSVKSNIGHLEAAAGIAGIIKTSLMLKHKKLVPSINYNNPNPYINFNKMKIEVQTKYQDWENEGDDSLIAGVSSFGIGGTNAHVILKNFVENNHDNKKSIKNKYLLLPLSANSEDALKTYCKLFIDYLKNIPADDFQTLNNICYTASLRRTHHSYRIAVIFNSKKNLIHQLKLYCSNKNDNITAGNINENKLIDECLKNAKKNIQNNKNSKEFLVNFSKLYISDYEYDFNIIYENDKNNFIKLPLYPFQRKEFWFASKINNKKGSLNKIIELTKKQSKNIPINLNLDSYEKKWNMLEKLTDYYISDTLKKIIPLKENDNKISIKKIFSNPNLLNQYYHLINRWIERLIDIDYMEKKKNILIFKEKYFEDNTGILNNAGKEFDDIPYLFDYLKFCGENLFNIITGKINALETLFPGGSLKFAEKLYVEWPVAEYFNNIASEFFKAYMVFKNNNKKIKILEIGAGTGGTSNSVFKVLPQDKCEYYYTDISDFFFNKIKNKFSKYSFINYKKLDIEKDPQEQGFKEKSFDIILAANVIHAAKNIFETITNIKKLIKKDGVIILNEVTSHFPWFNITTGLIEGWSRYNDGIRKNNPLLSPDEWKKVFYKSGFKNVFSFPDVNEKTSILGQNIIIVTNSEEFDFTAEDKNIFPKNSLIDEVNTGIDKKKFMMYSENEKLDFLTEYFISLVAENFEIDKNEIDFNKPLIEYGIDSLIALQINNKIEKDFNIDIPIIKLFEEMTVSSLINIIINRKKDDIKNQDDKYDMPVINCLSDNNIKNSKNPLFCITGGFGDITALKQISISLPDNQPFYELQPPIQNEKLVFDNIDDLSNLYISKIKEVQQNGPYVIGGYCGGGIVAFDVAKKLLLKNESVPLLILFDAPYKFSRINFIAYKFTKNILSKFVKRKKQYQNKFFIKFLAFFFDQGNYAHILTITGYKLEPIKTKIILIQPKISPFRTKKTYKLWKKNTESGIELYKINGDHFSFLRKPHDKEVVKILKNILK